MSIGVAMVGGGIWAREEHLPAVLASKHLHLKAVFSRSLKSAESVASLAEKAVDLYSDDSGAGFEDLLKRPDISALILSLPIKNQVTYIKAALLAGKHVLSEKPVAENIDDAVQLIQWYRSEVKGVSWCIAENWRFLKSYDFARRELECMGRILGFQGRYHALIKPDFKFFDTEWRKDPTHQGGYLLDGGVHYIAGIRQLLESQPGNQIARVSAFTNKLRDYLPPVDTANTIFKTRSGVTGTFQQSVGTTLQESSWTVASEHGWIKVEDSTVTIFRDGQETIRTIPNERTGVPPVVRAWGEALAAGTVPKAQEPEAALADLEILELILKSGASGETQRLVLGFRPLSSAYYTLSGSFRHSPLRNMGQVVKMSKSLQFDWKPHKRAILYCCIAAIGALVYGYDNTYYNGVLAMQQFKNDYGTRVENGQKALGPEFQSVTASSIYIGDLFGAILAAPIDDRWGRKGVFWFAAGCVLVGGITQVADNGHEAVITVGRVLIGLGVGQFTVTSLLYMGEVAPASIRGPTLMMFQFLQSCSQLIASGLTQGTETIKNNSLSYKLPMGGLIVLPLFLFAGLPFIPESPVWYILKGRREDAVKSLRKINRSQPEYDETMDIARLEETKAIEEQHAEFSTWKSLITDSVERRKVLYSAGAMFSQQICGILFFYVYGVVFAQAIGIQEPFLIQLITNILQIFAVGASVITGNKIRRRVNLLVTNSMMLFAFVVIGGIGTQRILTTVSQYVIVVFSFVVIIGFNFGPGPLAYTIAREMAVGTNQNKIMSVSIVVFYLATFIVSFTAPYLYYNAGLGPKLGFVYAGTTLIALTWTWFCVGETAGRSNHEISLFFTEGIPVRQWSKHVFPFEAAVKLDEKSHVRVDQIAEKAGDDGSAAHVERV
ncbi:hypothetical protein O1611_g294 [Lasiodiplodia mahajangana]|uniref:Uncharacterized protein n=1 Tax=Lasiodiplodia mahajangana TaxID=1108764 RepID=A0ACC2K0K7_9PEZI|nr:hypothetical protein O1611_g294 [Lasiodiplodia mahajangana]